MATRSPRPDAVTAAAIVLEEKNPNSLLYNNLVIDYLTNSVESGATNMAWHFWQRVPELRYTTRYISNALSVATLYVGEANPLGGAPTRLKEGHPANELMAQFAGGHGGQADLLDRLGLHLTVAGDSVLIGPVDESANIQAPFDQWRVYSTDEVHSRNGKIYVKMPGNAKEVQIPNNTIAVRVWRPHPRQWWDADSPVKGSFSVLNELIGLDKHVTASINSRLAGAGLLLIPDEIDLPTGDMEIEGSEIDRFVALLTEVMGLAIKNRESAAALVPIMLRGPAEFLDKINHIEFSTPFSEQVPELRMGAIRRLALGMDVPPEILLGSAQSNSWSAWQTDESTLRVHLIPLLQLIASSLTVGWLRPALERLPLTKEQEDQIPKLEIGFDVSNLKIRQDVSGDAEALYDRMEIDSDALRLALGYGPDSAPDNKEIAKQILLKLVLGPPELATYAINALRDNFGIKLLPEFNGADAGGAPADGGVPSSGPGAPIQTPSPTTTEASGPLPGDRSQDKQVAPPPIPKMGDQSNNEVK